MNDRPAIEGGTLRLRTHSIHIDNRELMSITGVKDVGSFNENEVILMTDGGGLTVEGTSLWDTGGMFWMSISGWPLLVMRSTLDRVSP